MNETYTLTTDSAKATELVTTEIVENITTWDYVTDVSVLPPNLGDISGATISVEQWLVPLILGLVTIIGVIGNATVIFVVLKNGKMHTVTNFYIVNLAITDITFLTIVVPFAASLHVSSYSIWYFGRSMCKIVNYMQLVAAQAACLTLTAMSVDRYQAIVYPLRSMRTRTTKVAAIVSSTIWMYSIAVSVPLLVYFDLRVLGPYSFCFAAWPSHLYHIFYPGYVLYLFIVIYTIPVLIISFCYAHVLQRLWTQHVQDASTSEEAQERQTRQKRKTTYMVLTVVIVFMACWLPFHTVNLWLTIGTTYPYAAPAGRAFTIFSKVLAYSNSCLNPFVYAFMGENFRKYFRKACPCCYSNKVGPDLSSEERRIANQQRTVGRALHVNGNP